MPTVIVIGGTDSSGGAGLSRDVSTLAEMGCTARPVVTAVTAQTDRAVQRVQLLNADLVRTQLEAAFASGPVGAVKTAMLGNAAIVTAVSEVLSQHPDVPLIADPVIASSSGTLLLDAAGQTAFKRGLLSLCQLVTPNLPEAALMTGLPQAHSEGNIAMQAEALRKLGARNILVKGGHGTGDQSIDWLFGDGGQQAFRAPRIDVSMRGTGCMLASAIAGHIAQGVTLPVACARAKDDLFGKLQSAAAAE